MDALYALFECVVARIWMSRGIHMNEPRVVSIPQISITHELERNGTTMANIWMRPGANMHESEHAYSY